MKKRRDRHLSALGQLGICCLVGAGCTASYYAGKIDPIPAPESENSSLTETGETNISRYTAKAAGSVAHITDAVDENQISAGGSNEDIPDAPEAEISTECTEQIAGQTPAQPADTAVYIMAENETAEMQSVPQEPGLIQKTASATVVSAPVTSSPEQAALAEPDTLIQPAVPSEALTLPDSQAEQPQPVAFESENQLSDGESESCGETVPEEPDARLQAVAADEEAWQQEAPAEQMAANQASDQQIVVFPEETPLAETEQPAPANAEPAIPEPVAEIPQPAPVAEPAGQTPMSEQPLSDMQDGQDLPDAADPGLQQTSPVDSALSQQPAQQEPGSPGGADYEALSQAIANAALQLTDGSTDGWQCTQVATQALINAGAEQPGADVLWPDQYAEQYGTYTADPQPGNLIYYNNGGRGVDHIAVYVGDGQAVHGNYLVDGQVKTTVASADHIYTINGEPGGAPQYIQVDIPSNYASMNHD